MPRFIFVTSNEHKVKTAKVMCDKYNISFGRENIDIVEIQSSGEEIALDKARQAYKKFKSPVVVTDDSWNIPGLNGFPGAYMRYVNQWLKPKDFINLTHGLSDRRIIMEHVIAYKDSDNEKIFTTNIPGVLLTESRGSSIIPHFSVMSFDGGKTSVAESEKGDNVALESLPNSWKPLCEWLTSLA